MTLCWRSLMRSTVDCMSQVSNMPWCAIHFYRLSRQHSCHSTWRASHVTTPTWISHPDSIADAESTRDHSRLILGVTAVNAAHSHFILVQPVRWCRVCIDVVLRRHIVDVYGFQNTAVCARHNRFHSPVASLGDAVTTRGMSTSEDDLDAPPLGELTESRGLEGWIVINEQFCWRSPDPVPRRLALAAESCLQSPGDSVSSKSRSEKAHGLSC